VKKEGQVFNLAIEADSLLPIYLWLNNAAQDNRPLPSGYNGISPLILLFFYSFLIFFLKPAIFFLKPAIDGPLFEL